MSCTPPLLVAAGVAPPPPQAVRLMAPTARIAAALALNVAVARDLSCISLPFVAGVCGTKSVHSVSPKRRCASQKTKFHYLITKLQRFSRALIVGLSGI